MPEQSLRSCDFKIAYGPSEDLFRTFYAPALSHCISYDCMIGTLSSASLAAAASGAERLIRRQGTMRLLAGVKLDKADLTAAREGREVEEILSEKLLPLMDIKAPSVKGRLEILAWMAATDTLRIRIFLPRKGGQILSASDAGDEYSPRTGIFTDSAGLQVALQSWRNDEERFFVFKSWDAGAPYLAVVRHYFEHLWEGREDGWMTLPLPAIVMDRLIRLRTLKPPVQDEPENVAQVKPELASKLREKLVFQFLRDIPEFPGATAFPSAADLERALTGSGALKNCWERHPELHDAWHLRWQGKRLAVTFDPECFQCHREDLVFLTNGDPLLQNLLEAVSALKTPEMYQIPLVRYSVAAPGFPVAYYHLRDDDVNPVLTLASLEAVFQSGLPEVGLATASESRARDHFNALVRDRQEVQARKDQSVHRTALRELEGRGKRILVKSALCEIARSRHATLFDQNLIAAGFDEETLLRQGEKSPHLAKLLSVMAVGRLKPAFSDPFLTEIDGKPEETIREIEESLQNEAQDLLKAMTALKNRKGELLASPAIDIQRFYKKVRQGQPPLMLVISPPTRERFMRYLPFYSLAVAVEKFGRHKELKEEGWMEVEAGRKLQKTMWVTRMKGQSMVPLIADGGFAVFDTAVPEILDGLILLVQFRGIHDPDLGDGITIRRFAGAQRVESRKAFRYGEIRLEPLNPEYPSIVLKDVQSDDFKVVGRYISTI